MYTAKSYGNRTEIENYKQSDAISGQSAFELRKYTQHNTTQQMVPDKFRLKCKVRDKIHYDFQTLLFIHASCLYSYSHKTLYA